jgi:hypothetical protein
MIEQKFKKILHSFTVKMWMRCFLIHVKVLCLQNLGLNLVMTVESTNSRKKDHFSAGHFI